MRLRTAYATAAVALLAAGCGSSSGTSTSASSKSGKLTVFGASSLSKVLPKIHSAAYSFGGSDTLETQIKQGAPADVFAAAAPKQTTALYKAGLASKPVTFATNTLVMIVPKSNPAHIKRVSDVTRPGVKIVVCEASQPCGTYASGAFKSLGITKAATKNVVSKEANVSQVVAQIAAGEGDVGFVYITDAKTAANKVTPIKLPAKAKPKTKDTVSVVKASKNQAAAKAYVKALSTPAAQKQLQAAGFGKP
ncbi:MAG: molybdate ABC transporter substrate-binding protein [Solirubrobacterales bacterium]|nr:molybdate ABC transporter substrate-binding protein [Solirubrobacterales bacterium]